MNFEYLPDVATADIAFRAWGNTLNELFMNCALATADTIMNLDTVGKKEEIKVKLESDDIENLLYHFLSEIVYYKDAESLFFSEFQVSIDGLKLKATLKGEKFNKNMDFKNDVKAITMHMMKIQKKDKYYATVVVDI